MKKLLIQTLILIAATAGSVQAQSNETIDPLIGKWSNEDKSRVIEFRKAGDKFEGIIISASEARYICPGRIVGFHVLSKCSTMAVSK